MKTIAKINFSLNGKYYIKGEELKDIPYSMLVKLNELGYIEPLKYEDLVLLKNTKKENNKEE